jgi:hypothetical protein
MEKQKTKLNKEQSQTLIDAIKEVATANPDWTHERVVKTALGVAGLATVVSEKFTKPGTMSRWWHKAHGTNPNRTTAKITDCPALDTIRQAEAQIAHAVHKLEDERDQIQRKLMELDNTIARYKQFTR